MAAQTVQERIDILVTRKAQLDALEGDLYSTHRPTYTVDGQTMKWGEWAERIESRLKAVQKELDALVDVRDGGGFVTGQIHVEN